MKDSKTQLVLAIAVVVLDGARVCVCTSSASSTCAVARSFVPARTAPSAQPPARVMITAPPSRAYMGERHAQAEVRPRADSRRVWCRGRRGTARTLGSRRRQTAGRAERRRSGGVVRLAIWRVTEHREAFWRALRVRGVHPQRRKPRRVHRAEHGFGTGVVSTDDRGRGGLLRSCGIAVPHGRPTARMRRTRWLLKSTLVLRGAQSEPPASLPEPTSVPNTFNPKSQRARRWRERSRVGCAARPGATSCAPESATCRLVLALWRTA